MLPLAERLRPKTLKEYIGQKHLVGEGAILRQMIERGTLSSFILWGPPGVGKTSVAYSIARSLNRKMARIALGGVHECGEPVCELSCLSETQSDDQGDQSQQQDEHQCYADARTEPPGQTLMQELYQRLCRQSDTGAKQKRKQYRKPESQQQPGR